MYNEIKKIIYYILYNDILYYFTLDLLYIIKDNKLILI